MRQTTPFALAFALLVSFAFFLPASAHPLGNFTINHYARLEIAPTQVQLYLALDYAEIPTFQEKQKMDRNDDGKMSDEERAEYLATLLDTVKSNLTLDLGGSPAALTLVPNSPQLEFLPGQGGLEIMQIRARFTAPLDLTASPLTIRYRDDNYRERLGWREIVAKPMEGVAITQSNVRATETSNELRNYPQDLLSNPLNDREANLTVGRGGNGGAANSAPSGANSSIVIALLVGIVVVVLAAALWLLRRKPNSTP